MRTFKLLKQILSLFFFISILLGYNTAFAESTETKDAHHAQNNLDWPGIYYGFTPCDDCDGIKTTLALNKNSSYILITQYVGVGKSIRDFVEKGKFAWGHKTDTIVLTPRKSTQTKHYLVGENRLIQLDNNGDPISGELANRYVLHRTEVVKPPSQHGSH